MAKLRGAAKAAFLRRMAAGRRKSSRRKRNPRVGMIARTRARRGFGSARSYAAGMVRRRVLRNPMSALIANPSWVPALYGGDSVSRRKRRKTTMAKRKRKSGKRRRRASTRPTTRRSKRRVYRRRPRARRRYRRGGGGPFAARVRRGTRVIYINGRKGRRRFSRRRNGSGGGIMGTLKRAFVPYAAGFVVSLGAAVLDTGLAKWPAVRSLAKVGGVLVISGLFGRRYPAAASAAVGALAATQGYSLGTKLAGGLIAHTPAEAVKGLGPMAQNSPEIGALLQGGLGALLSGPSDIDSVASRYQSAVANMAGDDDED